MSDEATGRSSTGCSKCCAKPGAAARGNRTVTLKNVRPPAKTLSLSAEAIARQRRTSKPVAFVFGPENGAVSEKLVFEAAREAQAKSYAHLYVIGFAIEPNARQLIEKIERGCRHPGDLRAGDARPDDGRPAEEHAVEPDLQCRAACRKSRFAR